MVVKRSVTTSKLSKDKRIICPSPYAKVRNRNQAAFRPGCTCGPALQLSSRMPRALAPIRAPRAIKGGNSNIAASFGTESVAGVAAPETPFRIDRECR